MKTYHYLDVFVYDNYHTIGTGAIQSPVKPEDISSACKKYDFFRYFLDSEKELKEKMIEILEVFND